MHFQIACQVVEKLCIIVGQIDQLVRASLLGRGPEFISQHP